MLVPDRYAGRPAQWRAAGRSLGDLSPLLDPREYLGDAPRYLSDLYYQVNLASLRQSVQRRTADAWGAKSEGYAAILTVLAIVLSLVISAVLVILTNEDVMEAAGDRRANDDVGLAAREPGERLLLLLRRAEARQHLDLLLNDVPDDEVDKILWRNAAELYGVAEPARV